MTELSYPPGESDGSTPQTLRDLAGEEVWGRLIAQAHTQWHPPGRTLLHQGEAGTHVLAVLSGRLKVVRTERNGKLSLLAFRGPGELLGEMAVQTGGGRLASVATLSRCRVAVTGKADFERFIDDNNLGPVLARYAITRVHESTRAIAGGDPLLRLAATLVRIADTSDWPAPCAESSPDLTLTREELAQHLGISRNTVTDLLGDLRSCGVVTRRGHIVISDLTALRRTAAELDG